MWTRNLICLLLFLFSAPMFGQVVDTIIYRGDLDEYINIMILGDGYTESNHQNGQFLQDAQELANDLFTESVFTKYQNHFNVFAIKKTSQEEGADDPSQDIYVDTYYNSTYNYNGIQRLLVPQNQSIIYTDLASEFPNYDEILMLVNDEQYGGSGGAIATTSVHSQSSRIAIHELGHSFGHLKDEYYAGDGFASEAPNMTQNDDPQTVKWSQWIGDEEIGIYQHCCSGNSNNWHKPHENCLMKSLSKQFCAVCKETIIDKVYGLVDPFVDRIPSDAQVSMGSSDVIEFGSNLIYPNPSTLLVQWELNGQLLTNKTGAIEDFESHEFPIGDSQLKLIILDTTECSRSFLPEDGYQFEMLWTIIEADCDEVIELDEIHSGQQTYTAQQTILSTSQIINGFTTYDAGISIQLDAGFTVMPSAEFLVKMDGCQ